MKDEIRKSVREGSIEARKLGPLTSSRKVVNMVRHILVPFILDEEVSEEWYLDLAKAVPIAERENAAVSGALEEIQEELARGNVYWPHIAYQCTVLYYRCRDGETK